MARLLGAASASLRPPIRCAIFAASFWMGPPEPTPEWPKRLYESMGFGRMQYTRGAGRGK